MNKKALILALFGGLALLQIGVPVSMIVKQEAILRQGQEFRFRTEPVDPFDAFRGRYVALRLQEDKAPRLNGVNLKDGQNVFAIIAVSDDGFAKFSRVAIRQPKDAPYLKARVSYVTASEVHLDLPIDRYYMEEKKAPEAEELYRRHSSRNRQDAYVLVAIDKGNPAVKKLYVAGKPIEEAFREGVKK